jgi:aconitate hydratase
MVFADGKTRRDYALTGRETIDIPGLSSDIKPNMKLTATVRYPDGGTAAMPLVLLILTADEVAYYKNGGILQYVLRNLVAA